MALPQREWFEKMMYEPCADASDEETEVNEPCLVNVSKVEAAMRLKCSRLGRDSAATMAAVVDAVVREKLNDCLKSRPRTLTVAHLRGESHIDARRHAKERSGSLAPQKKGRAAPRPVEAKKGRSKAVAVPQK